MSIPVLKLLSLVKTAADLTTSWSLLLGIIVVVLQFVSSIILVIVICLCIHRIQRLEDRRRRRSERRTREEYVARCLQNSFHNECISATDDTIMEKSNPRDSQQSHRNEENGVSTVCSRNSQNLRRSVCALPSTLPHWSDDHAALPAYEEISAVNTASIWTTLSKTCLKKVLRFAKSHTGQTEKVICKMCIFSKFSQYCNLLKGCQQN